MVSFLLISIKEDFSRDKVPDHDNGRGDDFCDVVFEQLRYFKWSRADVCEKPNCQVVDAKTNDG